MNNASGRLSWWDNWRQQCRWNWYTSKPSSPDSRVDIRLSKSVFQIAWAVGQIGNRLAQRIGSTSLDTLLIVCRVVGCHAKIVVIIVNVTFKGKVTSGSAVCRPTVGRTRED